MRAVEKLFSLFLCVCSDYGTICVSIHELGCILNSISTQISLSYRVWDGGLVRNTVHHSEGQTWTSSWIFAGLSAVASNCWKVDEELCPRTPLFQITETVFFVCPAACSICVSFLAVCNTASYVVYMRFEVSKQYIMRGWIINWVCCVFALISRFRRRLRFIICSIFK